MRRLSWPVAGPDGPCLAAGSGARRQKEVTSLPLTVSLPLVAAAAGTAVAAEIASAAPAASSIPATRDFMILPRSLKPLAHLLLGGRF
jgi:hypothetical protein